MKFDLLNLSSSPFGYFSILLFETINWKVGSSIWFFSIISLNSFEKTQVLIVIFHKQMPVHYFNQLGDAFVYYLLENIENPLSREHERDVCDVFIGLLLSYNLQFKDKASNVTVKCLKQRNSAKAFTEQVTAEFVLTLQKKQFFFLNKFL